MRLNNRDMRDSVRKYILRYESPLWLSDQSSDCVCDEWSPSLISPSSPNCLQSPHLKLSKQICLSGQGAGASLIIAPTTLRIKRWKSCKFKYSKINWQPYSLFYEWLFMSSFYSEFECWDLNIARFNYRSKISPASNWIQGEQRFNALNIDFLVNCFKKIRNHRSLKVESMVLKIGCTIKFFLCLVSKLFWKSSALRNGCFALVQKFNF